MGKYCSFCYLLFVQLICCKIYKRINRISFTAPDSPFSTDHTAPTPQGQGENSLVPATQPAQKYNVLFCPGDNFRTPFLHKNGENCWYYKRFRNSNNSPKCFCGRNSAPGTTGRVCLQTPSPLVRETPLICSSTSLTSQFQAVCRRLDSGDLDKFPFPLLISW